MTEKNKGFLRHSRQASLALLASFAVAGASAQGTIQSVTGGIQGGMEVVRIELSEAPATLPTGFAIPSSARIALDFPNTANALGRSTIDVNQGNLRSINVVQAGDRSRLVLNLKHITSYRTEIQGKQLLVLLEPVGRVAPESEVQPVATKVAGAEQEILPLKDIDFRRGTEGGGRVVVGLSGSQVGVDVQPKGKGLLVEFLQSSLPEGLRRRFDVSDFGTPVQLLTVTQQGERVQMQVEATGDWEHSAYQSGSEFVLEVRPRKVDLNKLTQGPAFSGEKLSLNFQNIEVRSLLQVIADFTDFNIVTSDTVTGSLTLRLKDVPWDQALQIIMDAKGLGMKKTGSVLWIAPKDEIDARTKKDLEAASAIQNLEPLKTQAYQLNYAKADDMVKQIASTSVGSSSGVSGASTRFLSPRGSAISEPRTNQIFVTDIPAKLEEVRQLLATLDVPVRQVMIEARIVEARDTFGRSLGVRLGATDLRAERGGDGGYSIGGNNRIAFGTNYNNAVASSGGGGTVNTTQSFVTLPAALSNTASFGNFALSIFNSSANRFLNLELSAMEADGQGKIVSSPRLITADQVKALIEQGTEYPYTITAPNGATTIAFKKAVLKLEVTPQITPEGNIILDLDVNKDSRGETTTQGVAIDTKHIETQVLIENGGTVVIGGIFELDESTQENKIPVLGDVPVMGRLFKNNTRSTSKREMLVFITPKVISDRGPTRQ
ncbi:MAG: type IV pilus secretin PilQ [Macromonas sp.]